MENRRSNTQDRELTAVALTQRPGGAGMGSMDTARAPDPMVGT